MKPAKKPGNDTAARRAAPTGAGSTPAGTGPTYPPTPPPTNDHRYRTEICLPCKGKGQRDNWKFPTGSQLCPACHGYGRVDVGTFKTQARADPNRAKHVARAQAIRGAQARGQEHVVETLKDIRRLRYPPKPRNEPPGWRARRARLESDDVGQIDIIRQATEGL